MRTFRGRSHLNPQVGPIDHPAAPLLHEWMTNGVPAQTQDEPWSPELKDQRFHRGCHQSATEHAEFLRDELATFIENGFWTAPPHQLVWHLERLQLSPAGVKPERDGRP